MKEFPAYLAQRQPHMFWFEEVEAVKRMESQATVSHLEQVLHKCSDAGYSVRVLHLNHSICIDMARTRIFVVGVRASAGGREAADWIAEKAAGVMRHRRSQGGPTAVWDVLNSKDDTEFEYLRNNQVVLQRILVCVCCTRAVNK